MISEQFFGETHDNPLPPKKNIKRVSFFQKQGGLYVFVPFPFRLQKKASAVARARHDTTPQHNSGGTGTTVPRSGILRLSLMFSTI